MTDASLWTVLETAFGTIEPAATTSYRRGVDVPAWVRRALRGSPVLPSFERPSQSLSGVTFLEHHRRTLYFAGPDGVQAGVIAVKGAQLGAPWNAALLDEMSGEHPRPGDLWPRSTIEHLIVVEHKVPLAVTLGEATREVRLARRVGAALRARFPPPYRIPVPLRLMRWPDEQAERHLRSLQGMLSTRTREIAATVARAGLGAVVYFYPGSPLRVSDTPSPRAQPAVVERWTALFARILICGVLPAGLDSRGFGSCCGPQNATLDGGFVDFDSMCPFEELISAADLSAGLEYSLRSLTRTLALYLGRDDPKQAWDHHAANIYSFVRAAVRRHLEGHPDPWRRRDQVLACFGAADSVAQLAACLGVDLQDVNYGERQP